MRHLNKKLRSKLERTSRFKLSVNKIAKANVWLTIHHKKLLQIYTLGNLLQIKRIPANNSVLRSIEKNCISSMACLNLLKKNTTPMKIMTSLDSTLKTKIVLAPFKTTTRGIRCRKYTTKLTTCSSSRLLSLGMQSLPHSAEWAHKQTIGNLLLSRKSFFGIYNSIRITPSISSKKKLKIIFSLPTKW